MLPAEIDTALHHMEHLRADNRLNVVVVPNGTFKGKVTIGLHKTIYFEGGEGKSNDLLLA